MNPGNRRRTDEIDRLHRRLSRPELPPRLREQLHVNLALQRHQRRPQGRWWTAAMAAGIGGLLVFTFWLTPRTDALAAAALQHRHHELTLRGRLDNDLHQWLARHRVNLPDSEALLLSKNCVVAGTQAKHLRLRTASGAVADLLVQTSGRWSGHSLRSGENAHLGWRLIEPRQGVSVLVLYPTDHQAEAWQLVGDLFQEPRLSKEV